MAHVSRRDFVRGAAAIGFTSATGLLGSMGRAYAADTTGYKALVCLFLKGGMDGTDTILPVDAESHAALGASRTELWNAYGVGSGTSSRDRHNLLELASANPSFGGRRFGLPAELADLHGLYGEGRLAVVGNVGPLVAPTVRSTMESGGVEVPEHLFSHNDQQSMWMSMGLEGRRFGWGGEFADRTAPAFGPGRTFASVTTATADPFLIGARTRQYPGRLSGPRDLSLLEGRWVLGPGADRARELLAEHFASAGDASQNVLRTDLIDGNRRTRANDAAFADAIAGAPDFATAFPDTKLGRQLRSVASIIAVRGTLDASRQVFYAAEGGFDQHDDQSADLPERHATIGPAIRAFADAMVELGLDDKVTLFTASDFGRTVAVNGNGTDHGWGGHHFVVGGAVRGGQIHGEIPPYDLGLESYTASRGRLIPSTSVDQYAATLGRWFGLGDAELSDALPNLDNFAARDLGLFH